jgi:hypothetical protein
MKEVKLITGFVDGDDFQKKINKALKQGFKVKKNIVVSNSETLYLLVFR